MDRARGYIDSAIAATGNVYQQRAAMDQADASFARQSARTKNPKHIDRIVKRMARELI
jgi:hypothetical protein